jgi:hypothetical protein
LIVEKFAAFLWQIAPIRPVLPTLAVYKPFAVNNERIGRYLPTEVIGSNPAAPTINLIKSAI